MQGESVLLNLGCGSRYHPAWRNIDLVSTGPSVLAHDLSKGIPFPDGSVHAVYHSHLLEHLRRDDASRFLQECRRVLIPGGILRIATPDLERICTLYLEKLQAAADGDVKSSHDYTWLMIEMYDQVVRESKGGEMLKYLAQRPMPNESFVYERIGVEGRELAKQQGQRRRIALLKRIRERGIWRALGIARQRAASGAARLLIRTLLGRQAAAAFNIGQMRLSGEVHQWMYDRYSLQTLLAESGFENAKVRSATESDIPGWTTYFLDMAPEGEVRKADSLFMEARKPLTVAD